MDSPGSRSVSDVRPGKSAESSTSRPRKTPSHSKKPKNVGEMSTFTFSDFGGNPAVLQVRTSRGELEG